MQRDFGAAVANETQLRQALLEADIGPTLMVLAHLTGDTDLLDEAAPYVQGAWNYQQNIPDSLKHTVRERLVTVLKDYAASGRPVPEHSSDDLRRMMSAAVGNKVPEEYVPLLLEELRLGPTDTRALHWRNNRTPAAAKDALVVIIGAGFGGLCTAIRLQEAGVPFVILEKNTGPGGTWYENRYPGCGVDTPNHFYSLSFFPNPHWSDHFSKRDEIQAYIENIVAHFGLDKHIRYESKVTRAAWDEHSSQWQIEYTDKDAHTHALQARVLVAGVGHNIPSTPHFDGLDKFRGDVVHSACWQPDVPLAGRRLAMIGTGASGMQIGPAIAPDAASLTVFQRTPHWAWGDPNYQKPIAAGHRWAMANIPLFMEWQRFQLFWAVSDSFHHTLHIDPDWDQPALSLNAENHMTRERLTAYIKEELGGDEALMAKCVPNYPPYGKRMLRDAGWFRMLRRPNVELVTDPISHITENAVVTRDGTHHEVDAIIMATGFQASRLLWPIDIIGRDGRTIREAWGDDDPRAYKGMTVPGFPNLFVLAGPNTILAHGGSAIFHIECQVTHVMHAVRELIEGGYTSLEVRPQVHADYNERVDARLRQMVWAHPGVTSWYKNQHNRVTMTSPWRLVDFWNLTNKLDPADFILQPADEVRDEEARHAAA